MLQTSCIHAERVYSGEMLGPFHGVFKHPPEPACMWYWICPVCLTVGTDLFETYFAPETDPRQYWTAMRRRDPRCWVPRTYA